MNEATVNTSANGIENPVPQAGADNKGVSDVANYLYGSKTEAQTEDASGANIEAESANTETEEKTAEQDKTETAEKVAPDDFKELLDAGLINEEIAEEFAEIAERLNLNKEQATEIAKLHVSSQLAAIEALNESVAKWESEVRNDPEIGGEKLEETLAIAKRGVEALEIDGLMDWLDSTGLGSHPTMIKLLRKVGQMTAEAPTVKGKDSAERDVRTIAEKLYKTG